MPLWLRWRASCRSLNTPAHRRRGGPLPRFPPRHWTLDGFELRTTDGGLMPPLPSSVEPSGIPAGPTDEPGPIDEARGGDAVADAAQAPGALAAIPPPSKSAGLDSPGIEPAMPADAPIIGLPVPADAPVIGPPTPADTPADA